MCLAKNIHHEARGEPFLGKVLVAKTVYNRVKHKSMFAMDICSVIYEPFQFSWTIDKKHVKITYEQFIEAVEAAYAALEHDSSVLYFHATHVNPEWAKHKRFLQQVGNHKFYTDK